MIRRWSLQETPRELLDTIERNEIEFRNIILVKDVERCKSCVYRKTNCMKLIATQGAWEQQFCIIQKPKKYKEEIENEQCKHDWTDL